MTPGGTAYRCLARSSPSTPPIPQLSSVSEILTTLAHRLSFLVTGTLQTIVRRLVSLYGTVGSVPKQPLRCRAYALLGFPKKPRRGDLRYDASFVCSDIGANTLTSSKDKNVSMAPCLPVPLGCVLHAICEPCRFSSSRLMLGLSFWVRYMGRTNRPGSGLVAVPIAG